MRVRHVRAEASAAGIPPEVVQFIAGVGHVHPADDAGVRFGSGVHVDDTQGVGTAIALRVEHGYERNLFPRRLHGHFW
jgi:hypothetical protein